MGFPRQEYWSELPFPTPGDLPDPKIEPSFLSSWLLHRQAFSLTLAPPGKPHSGQSLWRERAKGKVLRVLPPRQEEGWSHVEGWERPKEVAVHRQNPRMRSFLLQIRLEKILENWDMVAVEMRTCWTNNASPTQQEAGPTGQDRWGEAGRLWSRISHLLLWAPGVSLESGSATKNVPWGRFSAFEVIYRFNIFSIIFYWLNFCDKFVFLMFASRELQYNLVDFILAQLAENFANWIAKISFKNDALKNLYTLRT